jgi:hypothetical protein
MTGEKKTVLVESVDNQFKDGFDVLIKQYHCVERVAASEKTTGIGEVDDDKQSVSVVAENDKIVVRGHAPRGATVSVLNVQGHLVARAVMSGQTTIEVPSGAMYVVRVEGEGISETHKVIVK